MFGWLKKKSKPPVEEPEVKNKKPRAPKKRQVPSEKELATANGEPYFKIVNMDVNPENLHEGSFEFDWNDKMVANLVRAGYQMKPTDTDAEIIDRWFTAVCRHVVLETFEQYEAMGIDNSRVVKKRDIGNGRSEVS
jgi:hypothetical protein